jgi:hypothetical protein
MSSEESDFDPNDVAEEYELEEFEGAISDEEGEEEEEFLEEDAANAFEGFQDSGEPSTFTFQIHNSKLYSFIVLESW